MSNSIDFSDVSATVRYGVKDGVAVVILANPPVNGLGDTIRAGLDAGITKAAADDAVTAVVIAGDGRAFCGGADIRQFNTAASNAEPSLGNIIVKMQGLPKPVIAAIHGFALGGGLELALACHYRIAENNAQIGLPEVNLGLIPGGGGTQRLPRIIGAKKALDMIQQGTPVTGAKAAELGVVDGNFEGDPVEAGIAFAKEVAARSKQLPVVDKRPPADADGVDFEAARKAVRRNARNGLAQHAAINSVEAATKLDTEAGLVAERDEFVKLIAGPESAALRHIFFADREAAKVADVPKDTPLRKVEKVAIIGAGTMGGGITMVFVNAGIPVTLIEQEQAGLDRGLGNIQRNYDVTASKGKLTAEQVTTRMGLITPTLKLEDAADADLVIEAVFEEMDVKKDIFTKLDAICKPGAILASNTSRLDINEIASVTKRPADVIGLHFFSPANVMKLLEVVRGDATAADVIATSMKTAQKVGKIPVLAKVCEGFIGNRMLSPYKREADFLLEDGASPQQVDGALMDFGLAMGPIAMSDLAGLDISWATRKRLEPTRRKDLRYSAVADRLCEAGRFGQKTGAGFYRYEDGNRTPIPDPAVDEIIAQCAKDAGIERRTVTDEEIVERCILALVNEGAKILEEGIAQRASDIDVVYVNGYGFPAYRGGPMYYAQSLGLDVTLAKIQTLHKQHGEFWTPAPLLEKLVAEGKTEF
ncbi:short chain enoyl-CoA hydratase /3-hydroxyacyl-CoA dehydrogenase [Antricoccus suffuscus]|uniref:Short chain enoyl-CoA hydratase /3-hydroxyacyl-CoA dehydrogenase n=1 Tax=Antricoccus suffuscus TaxID=1629062 RepID=A0A2T0ZVS3_9ACTN|nr:3-hydroxyacyl-CoA dehydrogenase NAD-binding domain-containing protein [Antricoccus suffuscus]PRZ40450.1 short chain enoyl-CoA hydratase /3-hydroxyacyl-CoA dehydrogenase [Antricoccus suffuscus]